MSSTEVKLYNCMYGMELFKQHFESDEALTRCMQRAVEFYKNLHTSGQIGGPFDFNQMVLNLTTGDLTRYMQLEPAEALAGVDTLKFLPPEVINGTAGFGMAQDRYCLAVLLFAIRYFANPFDGKRKVVTPLVNVETAKAFYGNPVFVFDTNDTSNCLLTQMDSNVMDLWENDTNTGIKALFTNCFTAGIRDYNMRPGEDDWLNALAGAAAPVEVKNESLFLEFEGRLIRLGEGITIADSSLIEGGNPQNRIGVVIKDQNNASCLALHNVSNDTWSVYMPDSREVMVLPGQAAPLITGTSISIGDMLINILSREG